ncbi:1,2-phenylacetyl-CoA epoxidase subunit PaaE [Steroidobacter sp.]|uniref:1,2-phenylacetyl-CoA epoxidase subunit PaaE n=1 Tax=Steroidobacter sp. TaxID=1978227 RepID=UPI001A3D1D04|nr:1,2-phenylacetyl-CoA epoxidase subunit PaaE [Steroidobacter sp.]MBL8269527.1 phenylacetate-CoA oxygenase/reductase subunit PaaK [Steroidobacter sp.]
MLTFHPLKVADVRPEGSDALSISFEVPESLRQAYRFLPGQHVGVRAQIDGQEVRRTYSICSAADDSHLRIGVRVHDNGSMSQYLANQLRAGDNVDVLTPTGRFFAEPQPSTERTYCAFAGGSGITPILGIVRNLLAAEPNSRFMLFYSNRTTSTIMFAEELLALKDRYPTRLSLYFILSREPQDVELFNGRLDRDKVTLLSKDVFDPLETDAFFLCGPGDMIDGVRDTLLGLGVDTGRIHTERFASDMPVSTTQPSPAAVPAKPKLAVAQEVAQITITMDGRQRTFAMLDDDMTVLDAAERVGMELPYSCRGGVCSTCRCKVTRGTVEMETNYALEPWEVEAGFVLCCQAKPTSADIEITYDER